MATDVYYNQITAHAAGVAFTHWTDRKSIAEYGVDIAGVAPYIPGSFYKRELPCLLTLLRRVQEPVDVILVDGFVDTLPDHPGLGRRLYDALGKKVHVVGVAKSWFVGAQAIQVLRGSSKNPLYVTAAGMDAVDAADLVRQMHGRNRIPTILKRVDDLSRGR